MASHDGLRLDLHPREHSIQLQLAGDLDVASAGRLRAALVWLRRRYAGMIVVDTQGLDFVDLAGYRVLEEALRRPDGRPDPFAVHVEGGVVTRLRWHIAMAGRWDRRALRRRPDDPTPQPLPSHTGRRRSQSTAAGPPGVNGA